MEEVAAEDIRASLAAGQPADHLLPIAVATYIKDHNLYGDG
jgi:nicotinic acid mononucleotide adenylyltransferase